MMVLTVSTVPNVLEDRPLMILYFPGIHNDSTQLKILLAIFNVLMIMVSFVAIPAGDMLLFAVFGNITMLPQIIREQMEQLEEAMEKKKVSPTEITQKMIKFILMHKRYNE